MPKVTSPLLRIPAHVGIRIFAFAGLDNGLSENRTQWDCIHFDPEPIHRTVQTSQGKESRAEYLRALSHTLFTVSKQIRLEAHCALYGCNRVYLHACHDMLNVLQQLDPLVSMSFRNVVLDPWSMEELEDFARFMAKNCNLQEVRLSLNSGVQYAVEKDDPDSDAPGQWAEGIVRK